MSTNDDTRSSEKNEVDWTGLSLSQPTASANANTAAVFHAVRRNWLLGLALGVISAAICGVAAYWLIPNSFTPFAYIRVAMNPEVLVYGNDRGTSRQDYEVYKNTQIGSLKSPLVFVAALRKPNIAALGIVRRQKDPLSWLQDYLRVVYINDSEIMRVSLSDNNSQETADLINAIVDAYLEEVVNKEEQNRRENAAKLAKISNNKTNEVRTQKAALSSLAEELGAGDNETLKTQAAVNIRKLEYLNSGLYQLQAKLNESRADLQSSKFMLNKIDEMPVSEIELEEFMHGDRGCQDLKAMIAGMRQAVNQQNQNVIPGMERPSLKQPGKTLESMEQEYDARRTEFRELIKTAKVNQLKEKITEASINVAIFEVQEKELLGIVDKQEQIVKGFGKSSVEVDMMKDDLKSLQAALYDISTQKGKLEVESLAQPRIAIAQNAEPPKSVDNAKLVIAGIVFVALLGFALPMSGIVWWDTRKNRVNSSEDIAKGLGLPVIGSVPTIPGRAIRRLGAVGSQNLYWNVRLTESIDGIAAKLLRDSTMEDKRVVLITSAVSGECKTTLATQLAMSLARAGRRTVLVDFDLRHPAIYKSFQLPLNPGVCEALCGEVRTCDAVSETGMNNLFVMTAGQADHHALQALANGGDKKIFAELREEYEFVIIDGSPILTVADSRYLSQHVDKVVLSVFRDFSRMTKVAAACDTLETFGVHNVEAVVTSSTEEGHGFGHPLSTAAA